MFAKAIEKHHNLPHPKASQWPKSSSQPLKPTLPTVLNTSYPAEQPKSSHLKRTVSQVNGTNSWAGQEPAQKRAAMKNQFPSAERVEKLHFNVYFDENDFEDDENIDLDEDRLSDKGKPSRMIISSGVPSSLTIKGDTTSEESQAILPSTPEVTADLKCPVSSTPLPWSSSPLEHRHSAVHDPLADSVLQAQPYKKRVLPWIDEPTRQEEQIACKPEANIKRKMTIKREAKFPNYVQETGTKSRGIQDSNPTTDSPYLWNKTASALKEDQKRLRQSHKKNVKNIETVGGKHAAANPPIVLAKVFLSDEQRLVMRMVSENRKSVFFTGSAGTGKSVLLREIIRELRDKYRREPDRVAVTASTGLAACNIGGVTLHSFAGIGLGKESAPELVKKVKRNQKAKNRWLRTKVLIIDEISMVDGDLFDKLEQVARTIRNNGRPFGGIQLVITGDFFQLPPVPDTGCVAKFSFDAATWNTSIDHTIGLNHVFRQKDPGEDGRNGAEIKLTFVVFANMLNEMRIGKMTPESNNAFRALSRPLDERDDFQATELFSTRMEVDMANNARMKNLIGQETVYKAVDGGTITDLAFRDKLLQNCMAPPSITLKKGAQVMLIKNIDESLVNGSVGKVIAFMDERMFDIYQDAEDGFQSSSNTQSNTGESDDVAEVRQKLKDYAHKNASTSTAPKWPLVRFALADGNSRDLLCQRESWNIELPNGEIQASRSQVPLILAWALSIHKAQGQTLQRVKVDLGKIFEKGQAYVALSRATCQEGLQVTGFKPEKVMAHTRVRTFYEGLYSVQQALDA